MTGSWIDDLNVRSLLLRTARYLVTVFLILFVLDRTGHFPVENYVELTPLYWISVVIGASVVLYQYVPLLYSQIEDSLDLAKAGTMLESIAYPVTRNLLLVYVALLAGARAFPTVRLFVDLYVFHFLVIGAVMLTLITTNTSEARLATRAGAAAALGTITLGQFVDTIRAALTPETFVLAGFLLGLTIWRERQRLRTAATGTETTGKEVTAVAVVLLTIFTSALYFYRLGALHLHGDEHQVVAAAAGYYFTGEFYLWDWISSEARPEIYDRAWPHTILVAVSYALFGISEWSSRLPSALAGVLTVPISYHVFQYFTERREVALLTSAALVMYPVFVFTFRWTRMYALFVPVFLILLYLVYRALMGENTVNFGHSAVNWFVERYLDFNLKLGIVALLGLYLGYQIHINTLLLLPAVYLFTLYRYSITRERKYAVLSVLGGICIVLIYLIVEFGIALEFLPFFVTFFAGNLTYFDFVFRYPLSTVLGGLLFLVGLAVVHALPRDSRRPKMMYLYSVFGFTLFFMVFMADRYSSFAYVIHIVPIGLALLIFGYRNYLLAYRSGVMRAGLTLLLLASAVTPLYTGTYDHSFETLYYEDDEDFSTAYGTIIANYDPQSEAIFVQYPRRYYLRGLDTNATLVDMLYDRKYTPGKFHRDVAEHGAGWITWETDKSYHIKDEIKRYISENFVKFHGRGVDDTGVEVYYFDETMLDENDES